MRRFEGVVGAVLLLGGCVSVITPPADVKEPATLYLFSEALHKGLVLPHPDGHFVEYGYGDWGWYALNRTEWYHVCSTVLWPTQGALGRRLPQGRDAAGLKASYPSGELSPIVVERGDLNALREELDRAFDAAIDTRVLNEAWRMEFVKHDPGFWFLYNCHDAVAEWLFKVGCRVSWSPVRMGFAVDRP